MPRTLLAVFFLVAAFFLTGCAVRGPLGGTFTYTPPGWIGEPPEPIETPEPSGAAKTKAPPSLLPPGDSTPAAPPKPPAETKKDGGT